MKRGSTIFLLLVVIPTLVISVEFKPWQQDAISTSQSTVPHSDSSPIKKNHDAFQWGARMLIIFHQKIISPQDGAVCHYRPTCSAFGKQALIKHGFFKGILMTTDRLIRDNPYNAPKYDPVR